jgi:hypothetical protein
MPTRPRRFVHQSEAMPVFGDGPNHTTDTSDARTAHEMHGSFINTYCGDRIAYGPASPLRRCTGCNTPQPGRRNAIITHGLSHQSSEAVITEPVSTSVRGAKAICSRATDGLRATHLGATSHRGSLKRHMSTKRRENNTS